MSCYDWESGTIKIPAKEWASFRKGLLEHWNKRQLSLLDRAQREHARLKAAAKGKREPARSKTLAQAVERLDDEVCDLIVTVSYPKGDCRYSLKALPKKKDLKIFALSKDATLYFEDASLHLSNANRSVSWSVSENNRACESAHQHFMAKELFRCLDRITWTRGSGGQIVGNDEYNRDNSDAGGGGNYVKRTYSTAEQKRQAARTRSYGAPRAW